MQEEWRRGESDADAVVGAARKLCGAQRAVAVGMPALSSASGEK